MKRNIFKSWIIKGVVLGLLISVYHFQASADDFESLMKNGDKYYEQFDNERALMEYEKAYNLNPESYEALMKLTRAYNDAGEDIRGIRFEKSDSKGPNPAKVEKYWTKATQHAELLKKKFPDKAESYFLLATSYGHMANFKGGKERVKLARNVEQNCKKAIQLDPKYVPAYIALGIYYREVSGLTWTQKTFAKALYGGLPKGTKEDSEKSLLKALDINPKIIHAHFELAKTYDAMNKKDKVAAQLKEITTLPLLDHEDKAIKIEAERALQKLAKQ